MPKPYHRKERLPSIVPEAPWTECNPPIRPMGCSLEFWGGAVGIDRSLRIFDVSTNPRQPAGLVARASELSKKDRRALAAYMQALWGLFADAAAAGGDDHVKAFQREHLGEPYEFSALGSPEVVKWIDADRQLPDADLTVNIAVDDPDHEPIWLGFHDGGGWRSVDGGPISGRVTHWAEMLRGPA